MGFSRTIGSASPINVLEMQTLGSPLRLAVSEALGLRLSRWCFNKSLPFPRPPPDDRMSAEVLEPLSLGVLFHRSDFSDDG